MRHLALLFGLLAGGLTSAPAVAAPCEVGEVVITEIMAGPRSDQYDEWIEVFALASCELESCTITYKRDGSDDRVADIVSTTTPRIDLDEGDHVVFSGRTNSSADAGLELAYIYDEGDDDEEIVLPAAYYSSGTVRLGTGDPGEVLLTCGGVELDEAPTHLDRFDGAVRAHCADGDDRGGCTEVLRDNSLDEDDNDDDENWCVASQANPMTLRRFLPPKPGSDDDGFESFETFATPGKEGGCPQRDWPDPLEVRITEVMVTPQVGPEFVELHNASGSNVDVADCELWSYEYPEDAPATLSLSATVPLVDPGDGLDIRAGELIVLTNSGECLDGTDPPCAQDVVPYSSSLSFPNTSYRLLVLMCPERDGDMVEIDRVPLDMAVQGAPDGQSVMLDPAFTLDATPGEDTEAWQRWCPAGFNDCYAVGEDECDAGSPGVLAECPVIRYPDAAFPCRCSTGGLPPSWLMLGLPGLVMLRRRHTRSTP